MIDLTGKKFNKLSVIKVSDFVTKSRNKHWICVCDCGTQRIVEGNRLRQGKTKSCGCIMSQALETFSRKNRGSNNYRWKGYQDITGRYFSSLKAAALKSKKEFTISIEFIWNLYLKQSKNCILTGLPIVFGNLRKETTASLDRIDSTKGYVEGNVQWVHKDVNIMKNKFDQTWFIDVCALVTHNQTSKKLSIPNQKNE